MNNSMVGSSQDNQDKNRLGSSQDNQDKMTADLDKETEKVSSSAPDRRKTSKPIMEKRRRARINASLTELKTFLLDVIKKEGLRHNKMEKADILELTVKHLRQLQRQQYTVSTSGEGTSSDTFRLGFSECASEVTKFLSRMPNMEPNFQVKLLEHLSRCSTSEKSSTFPHTSVSPVNSRTSIQSEVTNVQENVLKCPVSSSTFGTATDILYGNQHIDDKLMKFGNISSTHMYNTSSLQSKMSDGDKSALQPASMSRVTNDVTVLPTQPLKTCPTPTGNVSVQPTQSLKTCATPIGNVSANFAFGNIISGIQLVPVQLPSGDTLYFIPTNILTNTCVPNCRPPMQSSNEFPRNVSQAVSSALPSIQSSSNAVIGNMRLSTDSPEKRIENNNNKNTTNSFNATDRNTFGRIETTDSSNGRQLSPRQNESLEPVWRPW